MALDWKNIDLGALGKSEVSIGQIAIIIASLAGIAGYTLTPADQAQIVAIITALCTLVGGVYSLWKRITAQPEHQTVIVPAKPPTTPPPIGVSP